MPTRSGGSICSGCALLFLDLYMGLHKTGLRRQPNSGSLARFEQIIKGYHLPDREIAEYGLAEDRSLYQFLDRC